MLEVTAALRRGDFALDVAFAAPTPGVLALFGRSGSGKTTLVHALAGLLTPEAGRIALDGQVFFEGGRSLVPPERRRIGCVFQEGRLFPHRSVLGNLRYGERRAPRDSQRIARDDVIDLLGLRELLTRRPHQLSGGERHRVAIGRALLSQPRLLLLDEPLAAQDLARRAELLPYLERLCRELRVPIVYVSHQFDEVARLATHGVLLEAGRVVAEGDVGTLSRSSALRAIVGPDEIGAVVEGVVESVGPGARARIRIGVSAVELGCPGATPGRSVRLHLKARDGVLALEPAPAGIAAEVLRGKVTTLEPEGSE
jgi:molybdate transport system ATP-binding protein